MLGEYFVTVYQNGRYRVARGPFPTHEEALAAVRPTMLKAADLDPRTWELAWGTSRLPGAPEGPMNRYFQQGAAG